MKRSFVVVAASLLFSLVAPAAAQEASPVVQDAVFADTLGLPELRVTALDSAFEGVPDETAAGRYVVTFTNNSNNPDGAGVHFMQLPDGVTADMMSATPANTEATPATEGEGDWPPEWFYEVYQAGGAISAPGQTAQVILDLTQGNYVVWGGFPDLPQAPVALSVTGEMGADLPEPEADVTVFEVNTEDGYAFELEGSLTPGPNTIRIENVSDQPHFFFIERYPEPVTIDQVMATLMFDPSTGTPAPGMLDESKLVLTTSASTQSAGTTQWLAVNLEPGSHIISCFIGDHTQGGVPHAFQGQIDVIQVGD